MFQKSLVCVTSLSRIEAGEFVLLPTLGCHTDLQLRCTNTELENRWQSPECFIFSGIRGQFPVWNPLHCQNKEAQRTKTSPRASAWRSILITDHSLKLWRRAAHKYRFLLWWDLNRKCKKGAIVNTLCNTVGYISQHQPFRLGHSNIATDRWTKAKF